MTEEVDGAAIMRLNKDLREAARNISIDQARFLVDQYYAVQKTRIAAGNQIFSLMKSSEPVNLIKYIHTQNKTLENQIKAALDKFSNESEIGRWARDVKGIGPVLSAGLISNIDIHKAPTVGHIWSFAGLDPTKEWNKGQKRPWNASLRTICWKIGESFVKSGGEYQTHFRNRKDIEIQKNANGEFAQRAEEAIKKKNFKIETDAYKYYSGIYTGIKRTDSGFVGVTETDKPPIRMLPPAHIHSRAKRYAVKLFLAHMHEAWYRIEFGKEPPMPYAIAHLGHAHKIDHTGE